MISIGFFFIAKLGNVSYSKRKEGVKIYKTFIIDTFFYLILFELGLYVSDFFLDSVGRCRTTVESSFAFDNKCQTFRRNNKKDCVITRIGNFEGKKFLPFFEVLSLGLRRYQRLRNLLREKALDGFDFPTVHELSRREQISAEKNICRDSNPDSLD